MKSTLLTLLIAVCSCCFAQRSQLRVEPASVVKDVMVDDLQDDYQDITPITVTNNSNRPMELTREQIVIGKPSSWKYGTFNRRNRTSPYLINSAAATGSEAVRLAPGESTTFYVVLQPDGLAGDGRVEIRFIDRNTPGTIVGKAVVTSEITQRVGSGSSAANGGGGLSGRPAPTAVRLFPNPARERFFVEAPGGTKLGRVEIRNTLGSTLKKYDQPAGKEGYDIDSLPDGLYMISIYDDRGKKLKTLRLLHRQFGA